MTFLFTCCLLDEKLTYWDLFVSWNITFCAYTTWARTEPYNTNFVHGEVKRILFLPCKGCRDRKDLISPFVYITHVGTGPRCENDSLGPFLQYKVPTAREDLILPFVYYIGHRCENDLWDLLPERTLYHLLHFSINWSLLWQPKNVPL